MVLVRVGSVSRKEPVEAKRAFGFVQYLLRRFPYHFSIAFLTLIGRILCTCHTFGGEPVGVLSFQLGAAKLLKGHGCAPSHANGCTFKQTNRRVGIYRCHSL